MELNPEHYIEMIFGNGHEKELRLWPDQSSIENSFSGQKSNLKYNETHPKLKVTIAFGFIKWWLRWWWWLWTVKVDNGHGCRRYMSISNKITAPSRDVIADVRRRWLSQYWFFGGSPTECSNQSPPNLLNVILLESLRQKPFSEAIEGVQRGRELLKGSQSLVFPKWVS